MDFSPSFIQNKKYRKLFKLQKKTFNSMTNNPPWKNLAPDIIRQRLIIEATTEKITEPEQIKDYLRKLSEVAKMEVLSEPVTSTAHEMGYGGWIHWRTSGAQFYSYPSLEGNKPLITVDIYTCKPFSVNDVVSLQKNILNQLRLFGRRLRLTQNARHIIQ